MHVEGLRADPMSLKMLPRVDESSNLSLMHSKYKADERDQLSVKV